MRQRDLRTRLVEKEAQEAAIVPVLGQNPLDDEPLLEALRSDVARQEDLGHAAAPKDAQELVSAKAHAHDGMIQYEIVRGLRGLLLLAAALAPSPARATGGAVAVFWQPTGDVPRAAAVRGAFAAAAARRGISEIVDAVEPQTAEPSLAPALDAAVADYAGFRFADALAKLDELRRLADARGGGDLDARQLAELYLYRALSRLEVGPADAAWDDLVRAARLDPARVIDPARFAPRVVAAYRRAAAEATQQPRAELEISAPSGAIVRVDGRVLAGATSVAVGTHLAIISAAGYDRWAGLITVTGAHERLQPSLRRIEPPDGDRLLAMTRARAPARILLGAVVRADDGWRFVARLLATKDGNTVSGEALLDQAPVAATVERVLARLFPAEAAATTSTKPPERHRWWIWVVAGGVAATLAVVLPIGIVYGTSSPSGTAGGSVGSLR